MFIINESAQYSSAAISQKHDGYIEFTCILQEAERKNRNGRIYHKSVLEQGLNSPYVQERLRTKTWYGEAGHPSDTSVQRQMTIDQRNIAFVIDQIWWEGNLLKAKCETADTAVGHDMMGLIKQGSKVAFSLRAQGNVHRDAVTGDTIVDSPIQIITFDWVVVPSHDVAYIQSICEETRNAMLYGSRFGNFANALTESSNLFENGELIPMNNITKISRDYTKSYNTKLKPLAEMYIPESGDTVKSMNASTTILENSGTHTVKKVLTEDYIVKDIRQKIIGLNGDNE